MFGHSLTLEANSFFVIVMFDCQNLPGKAVIFYFVCDVFMVTVDVAVDAVDALSKINITCFSFDALEMRLTYILFLQLFFD